MNADAGQLVLAVPVFNAGHFLPATLSSLNAQGPAVRWWLQDGASEDRTVEIARSFARDGDTVRSENHMTLMFAKPGETGSVVLTDKGASTNATVTLTKK